MPVCDHPLERPFLFSDEWSQVSLTTDWKDVLGSTEPVENDCKVEWKNNSGKGWIRCYSPEGVEHWSKFSVRSIEEGEEVPNGYHVWTQGLCNMKILSN